MLRKVALLRSGVYLAVELRRTLREPRTTTPDVIDKDFATPDPWSYEANPSERARFSDQAAILDEARRERLFTCGLEIGCAEGVFTEVLAERCDSLLVLDVSPTALARTQNRRSWSDRVQFHAFDLQREPIPGTFDLIVVAGVLEYFSRPTTLYKIREKLARALRADGYLLIETTRANPIVESSWWGRRLLRGRWINDFICDLPALENLHSTTTEAYCITLCRKADPSCAT
jgi:SAM-dependent methyltransferase